MPVIEMFGFPRCQNLSSFIIDVKQREQRQKNNEAKNSNSCATKKNITGFHTEGEPNVG